MDYNNYQNGDIVEYDLRNIFPNATICGQCFKDDNNNVEIYIPENEYHTAFYIKVPKI